MDAALIDVARWARRGRRRRDALRVLAHANTPLTATELGNALGIGMKKASETLRQLLLRRLVHLLDHGKPFSRRYSATEEGRAVADWMESRQQPFVGCPRP